MNIAHHSIYDIIQNMKKTIKKTEYIPFSELKRGMLRDPKVKQAYDDLQLKYDIICAVLDARAKKGLTQAELAKRVGTTQSAIARFESGAGNPTLSFVQKITRALDTEIKIS